jgi:hypothetical protein
MWAQDRAKQIMDAVEKAAPGYAARFDVIVCGDVGLGQMTTPAQEAIVRFVEAGGGFIYAVEGKSTVPVSAPRECDPSPLAAILPYAFPAANPARDARPDAKAINLDDAFLKGLDFGGTPAKVKPDGKPVYPAPLALVRPHGKGRVLALFGAFGASYRYVSYAKFEKNPGGWDEWADCGRLWSRLLARTAEQSPVRGRTRADVDAAVKTVPCAVRAGIDATREIDDVRAAVFSIVSLSQLYEEDGGAGEDLFLDLNPRDWFDRSSDKCWVRRTARPSPTRPNSSASSTSKASCTETIPTAVTGTGTKRSGKARSRGWPRRPRSILLPSRSCSRATSRPATRSTSPSTTGWPRRC